jgi:hypothetical protein
MAGLGKGAMGSSGWTSARAPGTAAGIERERTFPVACPLLARRAGARLFPAEQGRGLIGARGSGKVAGPRVIGAKRE